MRRESAESALSRQEQRFEVSTLFPASTETLGCVRLSFPLVLEAGRKSQVDPPGSPAGSCGTERASVKMLRKNNRASNSFYAFSTEKKDVNDEMEFH